MHTIWRKSRHLLIDQISRTKEKRKGETITILKFLVHYPGDVMQVIREKFWLKSESLEAGVGLSRRQGERGIEREEGEKEKRIKIVSSVLFRT